MRIHYLAHSSVLVITQDGARVLFDPYEPGGYGGALHYRPITETVDVVAHSHHHADHAHVSGLPGSPTVVDGLSLAESGPRTVKGVFLCAVRSYHDRNQGRDRGKNAMVILGADGLRLCHAGDLGHPLTPEHAGELGQVDILLAPVGGHFTIDAAEATLVMERLQPRIAIPMHLKTAGVNFPISPVDSFLAGKTRVRHTGGSALEISPETLPAETEVVVLEPALL